MEVVLFWLLASVVVGVIAAHQGRGGVEWTIYSVLITPVLALVLVLCLPRPVRDTRGQPLQVKCPDCAELVQAEARICKHCGARLVPYAEAIASQAKVAPEVPQPVRHAASAVVAERGGEWYVGSRRFSSRQAAELFAASRGLT